MIDPRQVGVALALVATPLLSQTRPSLPADQDPNDWRAYYEEGYRALRYNPARADTLFAAAARLEPGVAEPLVGRFAAWWAARPTLERLWIGDEAAVAVDSGVRTARLWLEQAFRLDPFVQPMVLMLAAPEWIRHPPDDAFVRGFLGYLRGDWSRCERDLSAALRQEPDRWDAHYWRALVRAQLGNPTGARDDIQILLANTTQIEGTYLITGDLHTATLYYTLALLHLRAGDRAAARAALEEALTRDLGFYWARVQMASVRYADGDTAGALAEYGHAVTAAPDDQLLRFNYGTLLLQARQTDSAAAHLRAAIALNPEYPAPYLNAAIAMDRLRRAAAARELYAEFLRRAPRRMAREVAFARQRVAALHDQ